ncbi:MULTISPECIES: hypothetical protein [unclassified Carboxylicivirga]|uniref:hypothetical protein n=1 Tax=Carboxylicivirga TaxID=1628153 RepID=UPI003D348E9E
MKHLLTLLLLLSLHGILGAQVTPFLSNTGQDKLYSIYQQPLKQIDPSNKPDSIEEDYLHLYALFIAYQGSENHYLALEFTKALDAFEQRYNEKPRYSLMHSTLLIQQSLLHWSLGAFTEGARNFYRAHRQFSNIKQSPYPIQYNKLKGLFEVLFSRIPRQFRFWAGLLGMKGDNDKGFTLLSNNTKACRKLKGEYLEARVLLNYCQLKFGEPDTSFIQEQIRQTDAAESPLLTFVLASLTFSHRMGDEGLSLLDSCPATAFEYFPLLHYARGRLLLNAQNKDGIHDLKRFAQLYTGQSFQTDALLRRARWHHLNEQATMRDSLITRIKKATQLPTSNDKQAKREAESLAQTPPKLLQARLLYDGGYYQQAQTRLTQNNSNALTNYYRAEHYYRSAQIEQQLSHFATALSHYDRVIALTGDDTRYIGPYSALEAAKIHLHIYHNTTACLHYLQQAEALNTGAYKKSIAQKIVDLHP